MQNTIRDPVLVSRQPRQNFRRDQGIFRGHAEDSLHLVAYTFPDPVPRLEIEQTAPPRGLVTAAAVGNGKLEESTRQPKHKLASPAAYETIRGLSIFFDAVS